MNKILFSLVFVFFNINAFSQYFDFVTDIRTMQSVIRNHAITQNQLKKLDDKYNDIKKNNIEMYAKTEFIKKVSKILFDNLSQPDLLKREKFNIQYAYTIAQDISKYQQQAFRFAKKNPKYSIVAVEAQTKLLNESYNVCSKIFALIMKKGENNLLNPKERILLMQFVIDELRKLRGFSYAVYRQMRYAERVGILNALHILPYKFVDERKQLVKQIKRDYKETFKTK